VAGRAVRQQCVAHSWSWPRLAIRCICHMEQRIYVSLCTEIISVHVRRGYSQMSWYNWQDLLIFRTSRVQILSQKAVMYHNQAFRLLSLSPASPAHYLKSLSPASPAHYLKSLSPASPAHYLKSLSPAFPAHYFKSRTAVSCPHPSQLSHNWIESATESIVKLATGPANIRSSRRPVSWASSRQFTHSQTS